MTDYKYKISLKLWHPLMHPADITAILGIEPDITFVAGEQRKTPTGAPLEGVYRESYWFANLIKENHQSPNDLQMEDHLFHLIRND
jgi:hypothetical protein